MIWRSLSGRTQDAGHLTTVLNAALRLDLIEHPKHKAKPISYKLLNYYAFHKGEKRYRTFAIPKKTPGETREIKAPDYGLLRLQRLLLRCLTAAFTTCDDAAHGFVPGRSILTNAQPHAGRRFVLNLDLKDFFPSTSVQRVLTVLQLPPFSLTKAVAHLVASLCCDQGSLPQGAPTSPLLTNAVCQRLDRRLRQLARQHRCTYTRYADDLTFSSNRPAFREQFHQELNAILAAEGYAQNEKKQRLQTTQQRQEVTGVVVNERPNVPREYVRQIRAMLHNWETKGYEAASAILRQQYHISKARARHKGKVPKLERVLAGKIAYLGMVQGKDAPNYLKSATMLSKLAEKQKRYERFINKFQAKIDSAINVLNALQTEYNTMLQSVISNKIDYSFIENPDKRNELEVLSRQLNMHLNGAFTPKQRERFDNVCRLAHKQMEGSLRYFFFKYYDKDLEKFKAEHAAGVARNKLDWEDIKPKSWRALTFSQMYTVMNFIQRNDEWYTLVKIFNDYRNTLSHFGYFEDSKNKEAQDAKFKKFKDEMPVLVVVDLLEETLLLIQIKLDDKKKP